MYVRNSFAWIVGTACLFGCTAMLFCTNIQTIVAIFGLGIAHGCFNSIYFNRTAVPKKKKNKDDLQFYDYEA